MKAPDSSDPYIRQELTGPSFTGSPTNREGGPAAGIIPFRVEIAESALTDLKRRLEATRWVERETVDDLSQGVPLQRMQDLVEHWRKNYSWRRLETLLNQFDQFRTNIDGLDFHFLHIRSRHEDALPLILSHGWPSSVIEFCKAIAPLTDPTAYGGSATDAFHVVIPSLPGFGFSGRPTKPGWNVKRVAKAWAELMLRLGYTHYVAQGGDWGATITTRFAQLGIRELAGIHLNWPLVFPEVVPTEGLTDDEKRAVDEANEFLNHGSGMIKIQMTRPQSIGYAMADSPAGQAAWIYEKFLRNTGNRPVPEAAISKDDILDNIMLYWLTDTAASSARFYWENEGEGFSGGKVDIPVGCSIFPYELYRAPRSWANRTYSKLIYWNELDRGGHFAAFELPQVFAAELRACFRSLRDNQQ